jgi:hypothetical protein
MTIRDRILGPRRDDPHVATVRRMHEARARGENTDAHENGALNATLKIGKGAARQIAREVHGG